MARPPIKPQGRSGPIRIGGGAEWQVIQFPAVKAEREALIANLFVTAFVEYVAGQSEPSLAPFGALVQNDENDIDFTVGTTQGEMLMELAEFAPLHGHGHTFAGAPKSLHPTEKAPLALQLIRDKSNHQGGAGRFLTIYVTEHAFWLDPITIELLRRALAAAPPNFERVFYVSPHDPEQASVSEIFPGMPHSTIGEMADEEIAGMNIMMPHPTEFQAVREISFEPPAGGHITVRYINAWPIR